MSIPRGAPTNPTWEDWPFCPCGCGVEGLKLTKPLERGSKPHVVGCKCRPHIGKRNRAKGQAANKRAHRRLGGVGMTVDDDFFHLYSLNISMESKAGAQVPASFAKFAELEWTRHALRQAEKKVPVGTDAIPSIYIELSPSRAYLVSDVSGRSLRP